MMASLLGDAGRRAASSRPAAPSPTWPSMRLARNNGRRAEPEIIAPVTMHFSFRLGAELMGIRLVEIDVDDETYLPRIEDVERAITPRTVGLVCSAPGGNFGMLDPIEAFADLALAEGPATSTSTPRSAGSSCRSCATSGTRSRRSTSRSTGVTSIMTDGHKLGLLPIATGFFLVTRRGLFEAIPTERTLIHTTSSTKPGSRAAGAWATFRAPGPRGLSRVHGARAEPCATSSRTGVTAIPGMSLAAPRVHLGHRLHVEDDRPRGRPRADGRGGLGPGLRRDPRASRSSACRSIRRGRWSRARVRGGVRGAVGRALDVALTGGTDSMLPPRSATGPAERRAGRHDPVHGQLATTPSTESRLVRLIHGDTNPAGPGFKQVVDAVRDRRARPGRHQDIRSGSYAEIPLPAARSGRRLHVHGLPPARRCPGAGEQVIASRGDPFDGGGRWRGRRLGLGARPVGRRASSSSSTGATRISTGAPVRALDAGTSWRCTIEAGGRPLAAGRPRWPPLRDLRPTAARPPRRRRAARLAARRGRPVHGVHFDGRSTGRALSAGRYGDGAPRSMASSDSLGARGRPHRRLGLRRRHRDRPRHRPSRRPAATAGPSTCRRAPSPATTSTASETDFRRAPEQYGAIHFHRDDLEDAGWEVDFELTIPDDLPSGIYAAWLPAGDDEDYLPFTVRPPRGTSPLADRGPDVDA